MSGPQQTSDETTRMLAAAGIVLTQDDRAHARAKLAAAADRMTPEKRAARRARLRGYSEPS